MASGLGPRVPRSWREGPSCPPALQVGPARDVPVGGPGRASASPRTASGQGYPAAPGPARSPGPGEGPQARTGSRPERAGGWGQPHPQGYSSGKAGTSAGGCGAPPLAPPSLRGGAEGPEGLPGGAAPHPAAGPRQDGLVGPPHGSLKAPLPVAGHQLHDGSLGKEGAALAYASGCPGHFQPPPRWVTAQGSSDRDRALWGHMPPLAPPPFKQVDLLGPEEAETEAQTGEGRWGDGRSLGSPRRCPGAAAAARPPAAVGCPGLRAECHLRSRSSPCPPAVHPPSRAAHALCPRPQAPSQPAGMDLGRDRAGAAGLATLAGVALAPPCPGHSA